MRRAPPTADLFRDALAAHQSGRLAQAIAAYRQLLAQAPGHLAARHYLGVALHQSGDFSAAAPLLEETVALQPANSGFLVNLGNLLKDLGRFEDAESRYRTALELSPQHPFAAYGLGQLAEVRGDLEAARGAYRAAVSLPAARTRLAVLTVVAAPSDAAALVGVAEPGADAASDALLQLWQGAVSAHAHAGERDALASAIDALGRRWGGDALIAPALELLRRGKRREAERVFRAAQSFDPTNPRAATGAAVICNEDGRPGDAADLLAQAIAQGVDHPLVWEAYADALKGFGDGLRATQAMRRALELSPGNLALASSLNLLGLCREDLHDEDLYAEAKAYGDRLRTYSAPRPVGLARPDSRVGLLGGARLRVGFLSPDLGLHPVGKFMAGFFECYPRDRLEVVVFNDRAGPPDVLSMAMRAQVAQVVDCQGWSDERLAQAIVAARLDVLVDLAGHTPGNRLPMLSWRLARRQGTFLGYAGTTGCPEIDFRIADTYTEPPGAESFSSERLIRLPGSYFCYTPGVPLPSAVGATRAAGAGLRFGCFVQRVKVTPEAVALWVAVLDAVPGGRMVVRCRSFGDQQVVADTARLISEHGGHGRFVLQPWSPRDDYLALYHGIDVALNTFPFHQATNLCDALWMGVPTLSLSGAEHRSRMAESIMAAAGYPEWCFTDRAALVSAAASLASNVVGLAALRDRLRQTVPASALADRPDFAHRLAVALESAAA